MNAAERFDRIAEKFTDRGVTVGALFGKRALLSNGKAFACLKGETVAFRLGAGRPALTQALAEPGAELFDPSGNGRPFKDWVAVPVSSATAWQAFAELAYDTLTN